MLSKDVVLSEVSFCLIPQRTLDHEVYHKVEFILRKEDRTLAPSSQPVSVCGASPVGKEGFYLLCQLAFVWRSLSREGAAVSHYQPTFTPVWGRGRRTGIIQGTSDIPYRGGLIVSYVPPRATLTEFIGRERLTRMFSKRMFIVSQAQLVYGCSPKRGVSTIELYCSYYNFT